MADSIDQLKITLKTHRQSLTQPRQTVFNSLKAQEPQTLAQITAACPNIDRSSVYRTIALFEQLGIVQRLQIGWKYKLELSSEFNYHHHHLTCTKCGKVIAIDEDAEIESRLMAMANEHRFKINGHQLEIQGICEACI